MYKRIIKTIHGDCEYYLPGEVEKEIDRLTEVNSAKSALIKAQAKKIANLLKEKEWLIARYVFALGTRKTDCRKQLIDDMQQALKAR